MIQQTAMLRIGTDCSGIEAPIAALRQLGIPHRHVWSCEIDKFARKTIEANYDPEIMYEDITKRDHAKLPDVDIYVCGFPCQAFSTIGKQLGSTDKRSNMMWECFQVIYRKHPSVFILENVKNFISIDGGRLFRSLMKKLDGMKIYTIRTMLLNTKDYGIPQNRERMFIVGVKKEVEVRPLVIPAKVPMRPLESFLENTRVDNVQLTLKDIKRLETHQKRTLESLNGNYVISRDAFMYFMNGIAPTIKTKSCHYLLKYRRYLQGREYLNLQGFPRDFNIVVSNTQITKQAGNAMSVCVLVALLQELQKTTIVFKT